MKILEVLPKYMPADFCWYEACEYYFSFSAQAGDHRTGKDHLDKYDTTTCGMLSAMITVDYEEDNTVYSVISRMSQNQMIEKNIQMAAQVRKTGCDEDRSFAWANTHSYCKCAFSTLHNKVSIKHKRKE